MRPKVPSLVAAFALAGCSSAGTPTLEVVNPTGTRQYVAADGTLAVDLHGGCAGATPTRVEITQNGKVVAEPSTSGGLMPTRAAVPLAALTLHGLPAEVKLAAKLTCDSDFTASATVVAFTVFPTARDAFDTPEGTTVVPVHGNRFLACEFDKARLLAADGHTLAEGPALHHCALGGAGDVFIASERSTVDSTLLPEHSVVFDAALQPIWNGEESDGGTRSVLPGQGLAHVVGDRLIAFPMGSPMTAVELDRTSGAVLSTLTLPIPAELRELSILGRPWRAQGGAIGILLRVRDAEGLRYVALDADFSEATARFTQATVSTLPRDESGNALVDSSAVMLGDDTAILLETSRAEPTRVEVKTLALGTRAVASVANLDDVLKTWAFADRVVVLRTEVAGSSTRHVLDRFSATGLVETLALEPALAPPAWLDAHPLGGWLVMGPTASRAVTWFDAAFVKLAEFERAPHFDAAGAAFLQVDGRLVQLESAEQALARVR